MSRAARARRRAERARRAFDWFDRRLALSRGGRKWLNYIFPDHWSFMIGEIALYSFVILVATGIFLTLYFTPSDHNVTYIGPYGPLVGDRISEAYRSAINLSFSVRAGLLARQTHHWAADIFVGAIALHMGRVFFTGAFRRPREANWIVGATLLLLAIMNGYLGYSLPGDLLSGEGVRIGFSIVESIPVVGSYLAVWIFGGNFPGTLLTERFYIFHVLVIPLAIMGLLLAHLSMIIRAHHTQFPGPHRREDNVVGTPMWPAYMAKSIGLLAVVGGVTLLLGAAVEINPIWKYGYFVAYKGSDAAQPDWYVGWLEGALRVFPSWEVHLPGHMIPEQFFPAIALPALTWMLIYAWPFLEARLSGDRREHHLLDLPRSRPVRSAFGAGIFAFYFMLFVSASDDVLASWLQIDLNVLLVIFRWACGVVPVLTALITWKVCHEIGDSAPIPKPPLVYVVETRPSEHDVPAVATVVLREAAPAESPPTPVG